MAATSGSTTHRERVLAALEHRRPGGMRLDLGSAPFTGSMKGACGAAAGVVAHKLEIGQHAKSNALAIAKSIFFDSTPELFGMCP
jgi:hypothetical protein